jgi:hypothetical protein
MTVGIRFLWTGEPQEGARLLDRMRAVAPVVLDDASLRPYTEVDAVHADPVDPMPVIDPSILLSDFPAEAAEMLLSVAGYGSGSPQVMVEVRQLGGAYARESAHPNAFVHRDAKYSLLVVGMAPDPAAAPHAELVFAAMADWDNGKVWPNFGPVSDARSARRAYDEATLQRLAEITRAYDPAGVLQYGRYTRELVR